MPSGRRIGTSYLAGLCLAVGCAAALEWSLAADEPPRPDRRARLGDVRQGDFDERVPIGPAVPANITVQLPTFGVAIDADGLLSVAAVADPAGKLRAERLAAAQRNLPQKMQVFSKLRKISLVRLERAIQSQRDAGKQLDEPMQRLAGLQRIHYVFCYPETHDVVIAGPAEGWLPDASGRLVGIATGQPVMELADLVVALRAYGPQSKGRPFIGCTIDPTPQGLARFMEFQKSIPRSVPQEEREEAADTLAAGIRASLGLANVRVFGVPADSHFAQVLIEAYYRMKLIGVGLEQPAVPITSFASLLTGPKQGMLERWWFTPNYDCVRITDDGLGMALVGNGVRLQGEDKTIGPDGQLLGSKRPSNKASELFTTSFTRKYPQLAARSPVYAQLRNLIDLAVAAAFIRRQDFFRRADWRMISLADEAMVPTQTIASPKHVACVANAFWNGNRLLMPAGGGVSIMADQALEPAHLLKDEAGKIAARRADLHAAAPQDAWWWD